MQCIIIKIFFKVYPLPPAYSVYTCENDNNSGRPQSSKKKNGETALTHLPEVRLLNVDGLPKGDSVRPLALIRGEVWHLDLSRLTGGEVTDGHFERLQHRHGPGGEQRHYVRPIRCDESYGRFGPTFGNVIYRMMVCSIIHHQVNIFINTISDTLCCPLPLRGFNLILILVITSLWPWGVNVVWGAVWGPELVLIIIIIIVLNLQDGGGVLGLISIELILIF